VTSPAWFDFEAQRGEWAVVVSVTDESGLETLTSIPMSVADVNEAPGFPEGALVWNVEEGTPGPFGNIGARDVDAGDTLTYSVATDPAGLFAIDPATGEVTLAMGATLDFESARCTSWPSRPRTPPACPRSAP
jgi:outer membrane protein assembly factor BamB